MTRYEFLKSIRIVAVLLIITGLTVRGGWTAEVKYPAKPIEIVITFAPGGGDLAFRVFTDKIAENLGQPLIYVYKPGAGGAIGAKFIAAAKPDGYTIGGVSPSPVMLCPLTKENTQYTLDDFVPICHLAQSPMLVAVKSDSPLKTLKDVEKEAKKSPGKVTYSTSGIFTVTHLNMEVFGKEAGIKLTHVPCTGSGPAVTALLGGHVDMVCSTGAAVAPHLRSGALRLVGVLENERAKEFPNFPNASELGYKLSTVRNFYGFMAPKGTPEEVVKTIYMACKRAIEEHRTDIEERLAKVSLELRFLNGEDWSQELKVSNETAKKIISDFKKPAKE